MHLFDLETERFIGFCRREVSNLQDGTTTHYFVDALAFSEISESNSLLLIVSYGHGELAVLRRGITPTPL